MDIDLPHNLWSSGSKIVSLHLPDAWQADVVRMAGHNKPALMEHAYRRRLASLERVIRGGKEICILFDDLSRPTRAYRVMPVLLGLFDTCGVRDEQVRFICALGTHTPLTNVDFRKKLGAEVLERFPVYNHNPYENCTDLGRTKLGTPVLLNKEYVSCDVRIGIGSCVPHSFCGLGGGYKLVMPGVAHVDSISYHHGTLFNANRDEFYAIGRYRGNPLLADLREAGGKAPLHAKIDLLVNAQAEAVDMYAGDPEGIDEAWCEKAVAHYRTSFERKADIVFVNTYAKGNEAVIAVSLAEEMLKDKGGGRGAPVRRAGGAGRSLPPRQVRQGHMGQARFWRAGDESQDATALPVLPLKGPAGQLLVRSGKASDVVQ